MAETQKEKTMKVEIYSQEPKEEEQILRLRLVSSECAEGWVLLQAVDKFGKAVAYGNLIHIRVTDEGRITFKRASGVSRELGLTLVSSQIVVE